jgi:quinol-cytochrome oxidoreductase complex cytochrome b subunit
MSDIQIADESNEDQEMSMPGELACVFAKGIAWVVLVVGVVFGFKFIGPFLKSAVSGPSSLTPISDGLGYISISCFTSAIVLFVLIAICENLIIMNKRHDSN